MQKRSLNDFSQLLNLLFTASNVAVSNVRLFLDLHHRHSWIDFRGQWYVDLVFVPVYADPHSLFYVRRSDRIGQVNDKLSKLLNIYDVFWVVGICVYNLSAPCHLQRLLILQRLFIRCQIPERRRRQPRIRFLDSREFVNPFYYRLDVFLDDLYALRILPLALEEGKKMGECF